MSALVQKISEQRAEAGRQFLRTMFLSFSLYFSLGILYWPLLSTAY